MALWDSYLSGSPGWNPAGQVTEVGDAELMQPSQESQKNKGLSQLSGPLEGEQQRPQASAPGKVRTAVCSQHVFLYSSSQLACI